MWMRRMVLLAVAVAAGALLWAGASSPAGAAENPNYTVPPPATVVTTPTPPTVVKTAVKVEQVRTRLAITGSNTTTAALAGLGLVGAGVGLMALRRRHLSEA